MLGNRKISWIVLCAATALAPLAGHADPSGPVQSPVQSQWQANEIRYSYTGFTTAYNCDALEDRVKKILLTLGAHPRTKVTATGCFVDRPSRNLFITITTATPVQSGTAVANVGDGKDEVFRQLDAKRDLASEHFPAIWKTVDLAKDRKLDLEPGDCELMEGLRNNVFPKLGVRVVNDRVQCTPRQLSIQTPALTVSALVPATADQKI
jgi:hypothetical protein